MYEGVLVFRERVSSLFSTIVNNYIIHIVGFIILGILFSYLIRFIYSKIKNKREEIANERIYLEETMKDNFNELDSDELKSKLKEIKLCGLLRKYPELEIKIRQIENRLINLDNEQDLASLENRMEIVWRDIFELEEERKKLRQKKHQEIADLKQKLNLEKNRVFEKIDLDPKEIEVLLKEGYKQVNEYCVTKRKIITILIKPILNHSIAHTFLVWSTRKLLEKYEKIEDIFEHETRDADLTFVFEGKTFAIEIETGSLLRKKKQLEEKIKYLNRKYGKSWMIVVSKRDLVRKYSKFGICTQRKGVCEKFEKMLKI